MTVNTAEQPVQVGRGVNLTVLHRPHLLGSKLKENIPRDASVWPVNVFIHPQDARHSDSAALGVDKRTVTLTLAELQALQTAAGENARLAKDSTGKAMGKHYTIKADLIDSPTAKNPNASSVDWSTAGPSTLPVDPRPKKQPPAKSAFARAKEKLAARTQSIDAQGASAGYGMQR